MPQVPRVGQRGQYFIGVTDERQELNYTCGPMSPTSILKGYGIKVPPEREFAREIGADRKGGSDPGQLTQVARKYGLTTEIKEHMTLAEVEAYVRRGVPIMVAYQAWTTNRDVDWKKDWTDGHYSIVIGMDDRNVYFEDPSLKGYRGYIPRQEFLDRWHDTDRNNRRYYNLGIIFTRPGYAPPKLSTIRTVRID